MKPTILASALLLEAVQRHNIQLSLLVADTGLWVNPAFHRRLLSDTGSIAIFPKVRRAKAGEGERRGGIVNGIRLDDNSYANLAIKRAAGLGKFAQGFEACHIWPRTCYDERYHTAVANIVLLPRALAGLSDHDDGVNRVLQYRAFELYQWWPEGMSEPVKPECYPPKWREPLPDITVTRTPRASPDPSAIDEKVSSERHRVLADRIANWSRRPELNVHKIIAQVARSSGGIARSELLQRIKEATESKNPGGALASLLTDSGNAYGRVLVDSEGIIRIHPEVAEQVQSLEWIAG